jgi:hypothetical protein
MQVYLRKKIVSDMNEVKLFFRGEFGQSAEEITRYFLSRHQMAPPRHAMKRNTKQ